MTERRVVRDSMGAVEVPSDAYYGASTARAVQNFPISELRWPRSFLRAIGLIKLAAARVNRELGILDESRAGAIERAAREVADGVLDAQFVVDVFQTGSGTSTHMNANEVIAARAAEILGGDRGDRSLVHPNDHVNQGQSSNDVFPTAIHVAALAVLEEHTLPALRHLATTFADRATAFADVVKAARTHLQDAVPITLGQEFSGYATVMRHGVARLEGTRQRLSELAIGGTAAGTGLQAHPEFGVRVVSELRGLTGHLFRKAENPFEALQNRDACVELSGALKTVAVGLLKIANDIRLLASGPNAGFAEIVLPATQPGSSIMPGKVNPVIPEAVNLVAAQVIGNDTTITVAGLNGSLDLNVMMPVLAYDLLQSLELMGNAARVFADRCVAGIEADRERCRAHAERSGALVTALAERVGYDVAAAIYKDAMERGVSIRNAIGAAGVVPEDEIEALLDLERLTRGGRL